MPLVAGTRLGPYEVKGPLGAGGMGEVYRAQDTRLGREVAIKVLPSHLSSNPDLRARFEREARAVSSLNHPHICVLHDVGHQDGTDYIVMELVEGETLQDRLKKGALALEQTLRYGIEIADALDKAHRQGVIHRDLKPGNVMLTKAGSKLMDFGLAKRGLAGENPDGLVSALPTREKPLTEAGSLLGTFQYMSPEQLEGKDADARTDIWALGCALYEMATGTRAFEGKSQASLISAIMTSEPRPIAQLQPMTPPALDRLVKVCLAKDPDDRLQTAHDVMQELKWVNEAGAQPAAARALRSRERAFWAAGLLATAAAAWFAGTMRRPEPEGKSVIQFEIRPPEGTAIQPYLGVSPEGTHIAFTAKDTAGIDRLSVFALRTGKTEAVAGSEGATGPFWSPDGRSVGFHAAGKLKRVEIGGGAPQTIAAVAEVRGATWGGDGWIVFSPGSDMGLSRVRATGGSAENLTILDAAAKETSHRWPQALPDGRLLYLALTPGAASISLREPDGTGRAQRLLEAESAPIYESGQLLFVREGALRAQSFASASGLVTGEPVTLAKDIANSWDWIGGIPVDAAGGVLAFRAGNIGDDQLTWFDRGGKPQGTLGPVGTHQEAVLSPDGRSLLTLAGLGGMPFVVILDVASGALQRLTFGKELTSQPCWSPDGRSVVYASNRSGAYAIYRSPVSGTGTEETLVLGGSSLPDDVSRDGKFLLYESRSAQGQFDLWILPLTGERKAAPFVQTEANEAHGAFSPDGRFVAYVSDATGHPEVYVRAFPSGRGPWQVSTGGGDQPRWRGDGQELFYVSPDLRLMAASLERGPDFKADAPRPLFRLRIKPINVGGRRNDYDVTGDGQRFIVSQLTDDPAKARITVVVNWAERLPR